ncbi:MAG: hypothetical protein JXB40_04100, partial [Candidatus Omnitrophica bacterium]|nr:hypothetical protein [Candidatus Omnitrophota bacterium]
ISAGRGHRALADALMTWGVFRRELSLLKKDGLKKVEDIERVAPRGRALVESAIRDEKGLTAASRLHNVI